MDAADKSANEEVDVATVNKEIADDIIAGKYDEDEAMRIVEYTNAWGGKSYGVTYAGDDPYKYLRESEWILFPRVYWDNPGAGKR